MHKIKVERLMRGYAVKALAELANYLNYQQNGKWNCSPSGEAGDSGEYFGNRCT